MPWAKLDDGYHCNLKVLRAGLEAGGLYTRALSWVAHNLTDGFLPDDVLPGLTPDLTQAQRVNLIEKLLKVQAPYRVGLFTETDGGWMIHDYLQINPTRKTVEKRRKADATRQKRARVSHGVTPLGLRSESRVPGVGPGRERSKTQNPQPPEQGTLVAVPARKRAVRSLVALPEPFDLTPELRVVGAGVFGDRVALELAKFKDHHRARGSKFVDWPAAWRNWCRKGFEIAEERQPARR